MSNKSEKNMGDFDGEESVCDEELAQLAAQVMIAIKNTCLRFDFVIYLFFIDSRTSTMSRFAST